MSMWNGKSSTPVWTAIPPNAAFVGTLQWAVVGGFVCVEAVSAAVSIATATALTLNSGPSGIPTAALPARNKTTGARFTTSGGANAAGFLTLMPSGDVVALQASGSTTTTLNGFITWPVGG